MGSSVPAKRGIYTIFTTFIVIVVVVAAIMFLTYINLKLIGFKEEKTGERMQREALRGVRDRLFFCYGNIVDEVALLTDPECLKLQGDQGISITRLAFGQCPAGPVKQLNFRGFGMVNRFEIPIYDQKHELVCPAYLTVYEHAVEVPLLLSLSFAPPIVIKGQTALASVDFFHTKPPSFIEVVIYNSGGTESMRLASGPLYLGTDRTTFSIDTNSLQQGLYMIKASATHDQEYFETLQGTEKMRVVAADDAPVINEARVEPANGTIYDNYRISVKLSDYLNITEVIAIISYHGVEVARVNLNQVGYDMDWEQLIASASHRGVWNPSDMPNQNASYDVSIAATNIVGNTALAQNVAKINITEKPATGGDVLIITNERVYNMLGQALIDDYQSALLQDGYTSKVVRLDNAEDVALCEETLSPAIGPDIKAADARSMVPQCIISFNSSYVLVLGGHGQVQQHQGGSYAGYVFYTDDYYADLNGDKVPELPIGRLPDGNPPGDNTVRVALQTATRLHQAAGWQSGGSHLAWTLDNPRGHGSPTNEHIECMVQAIDANNAINCNVDPDCYFAPPYNTQQAGTPSDWGIATDLLFVLGHGNPTGLQEFADHDPQRVRMGTASTIAQRDFTDTVLFYNPCFGGRIHNHDFAESSVLQALNKGAVAVFGGTTLQSYSATDMNSCNMLPISSMSHGSSFLTNLAYGINKAGATTIGDAWLYWHNRVTVRAQREHNVMYADPSIRVK